MPAARVGGAVVLAPRRHGGKGQTILGHRIGSAITEIYAEANVRKAREVMGRVG
jgi:hypothetical protein